MEALNVEPITLRRSGSAIGTVIDAQFYISGDAKKSVIAPIQGKNRCEILKEWKASHKNLMVLLGLLSA